MLHVSADHVDADFTAKLVIVRKDGYARIVEDGIARVKYRAGLRTAQLLNPGDIVDVEIDLGATALRIYPGERFRLEVSGGNFPKYDRNAGDGGSSLESTEFGPIQQTVHYGASFVEVFFLRTN